MATTATTRSLQHKARLLYSTPTTPSRSRSARVAPKKAAVFLAELRSQEEWEIACVYNVRVAVKCFWDIPEIHEGAILYSVHAW